MSVNLHVRIIEAKNILKKDFFKKPSPYILLASKNGLSNFRTRTANETENPVWNETFTMSMSSDGCLDMVLLIEEMTKKGIHRIAKCNIATKHLEPGVTTDKWIDLEPNKTSKKETHMQIHLLLQISDNKHTPFAIFSPKEISELNQLAKDVGYQYVVDYASQYRGPGPNYAFSVSTKVENRRKSSILDEGSISSFLQSYSLHSKHGYQSTEMEVPSFEAVSFRRASMEVDYPPQPKAQIAPSQSMPPSAWSAAPPPPEPVVLPSQQKHEEPRKDDFDPFGNASKIRPAASMAAVPIFGANSVVWTNQTNTLAQAPTVAAPTQMPAPAPAPDFFAPQPTAPPVPPMWPASDMNMNQAPQSQVRINASASLGQVPAFGQTRPMPVSQNFQAMGVTDDLISF